MDKKRYLSRAAEVFQVEMEALQSVSDNLNNDFVALVELCLSTLKKGGKLVLTGVGKSGHIGHKMAATLSSTGAPSAFMHPVEAMHGDLGILSKKDILLALSYSGETDELLEVLPAAKRLGAKIVAVTGNPESRLGLWSDLCVTLKVGREACPFNLAPTATTTATLAFGDALAMVLLDAQEFGKKDYAKLHPAGAIGRSITLQVSDLMRTGERFPKVKPDSTVRDALLAMTRGRSGSVAVVDDENKLLGIFTDGDFRRHITRDSNILDASIKNVMTADPVTVSEKQMAIEVLRVLEDRRIDDIIVVDGNHRAVGLVDVQDLPKFKLL